METNLKAKKILAELNFLSQLDAAPHSHEDIEIFYVLYGKTELSAGGEIHSLQPGDIFVINPGVLHYSSTSGELLVAQILMDRAKLCELLKRDKLVFSCSPADSGRSAYGRLKTVLERILELQVSDEVNELELISMNYQMAEVLANGFLMKENVGENTAEGELRNEAIMEYIRANYKEPISLQSLASEMYLSNAYLSKYIKKQFRMNYTELLNSVRLNHAMYTLLNSRDSMTKIAMNSGFASVDTFNRAFKKSFGVMPTEYRKVHGFGENGKKEAGSKGVSPEIRERVRNFLAGSDARGESRTQELEYSMELDAAVESSKLLSRNWSKMINAGTAYDLTRSDFQKQILLLREHIGFQYVRFWDVFSSELRIDIHANPQNINLSRLYLALDFLVDNNLKPFIELGFKPIRLLRTAQEALIDIHRADTFNSPAEIRSFIQAVMKLLIRRYGEEEVSSWYFEFWKREALRYDDGLKRFLKSSNDSRYFEEFDAMAGGMRRILPGIRIGGGGFSVQHYGEEGLRDICTEWKKHPQKPDFVSLNCFPYKHKTENGQFFEKKDSNLNFIRANVETAKSVIRETSFYVKELFVTEFNFTLSNRNVTNDSCNKACQLMQTLSECMNDADIVAYWMASDAYAEYNDTNEFLFGGVGLLSKNGTPKPAFYTFEFLSRLHNKLVEKNANCIVTRKGRDSWKIVCHNFRPYNKEYYRRDEDQVRVDELDDIKVDTRPVILNICLKNVPNGIYQVRSREINSQFGSIQTIWQSMNMESDLDRDDLAYIQRMCTPRLVRDSVAVTDGILKYQIQIKPSEIKYLHIVLKKN